MILSHLTNTNINLLSSKQRGVCSEYIDIYYHRLSNNNTYSLTSVTRSSGIGGYSNISPSAVKAVCNEYKVPSIIMCIDPKLVSRLLSTISAPSSSSSSWSRASRIMPAISG